MRLSYRRVAWSLALANVVLALAMVWTVHGLANVVDFRFFQRLAALVLVMWVSAGIGLFATVKCMLRESSLALYYTLWWHGLSVVVLTCVVGFQTIGPVRATGLALAKTILP
ncbi:hypothetical protein ACFL6C_14530 [Myxococcota bacterium]